MLFNHCPEGICFTSEASFPRRTTLMIRLDGESLAAASQAARDGLHQMMLAEVKWCRRITPAPEDRFMTGVRYLSPAW